MGHQQAVADLGLTVAGTKTLGTQDDPTQIVDELTETAHTRGVLRRLAIVVGARRGARSQPTVTSDARVIGER